MTRTMAVCRACSDETGVACCVPFTVATDRDRWVRDHVRDTGHDVRLLDRWVWPETAVAQAFGDRT